MIRGLALCAGGAGLELGLRLALGRQYRTVCYVERESFAASILVARMEDQTLDQAPVWDDLTTFDGRPWRGAVDLVSAGFPCQPVSVAGKRRGTADERWLWPHVARIIREVEPRIVFLENVPGLRKHLGDVLGALAYLGYAAEWDVFSAADAGASHLRKRIFILAHREHAGSWPLLADPRRGSNDAHQSWRLQRESRNGASGPSASSAVVGVAHNSGLEGRSQSIGESPDERPAGATGSAFAYPPDALHLWSDVPAHAQPAICRVADGLAFRVDRLRLLGNGVVPAVAAGAFHTLAQRMVEP